MCRRRNIFPTRDASPPLELAFLQAPNAITKRYHPTLSQNANSNGQEYTKLDNGEWVLTKDDMIAEMHMNKLLQDLLVEIGRASCRERV